MCGSPKVGPVFVFSFFAPAPVCSDCWALRVGGAVSAGACVKLDLACLIWPPLSHVFRSAGGIVVGDFPMSPVNSSVPVRDDTPSACHRVVFDSVTIGLSRLVGLGSTWLNSSSCSSTTAGYIVRAQD